MPQIVDNAGSDPIGQDGYSSQLIAVIIDNEIIEVRRILSGKRDYQIIF
jgi:hypothetical protein